MPRLRLQSSFAVSYAGLFPMGVRRAPKSDYTPAGTQGESVGHWKLIYGRDAPEPVRAPPGPFNAVRGDRKSAFDVSGCASAMGFCIEAACRG
jgi:hypothetical protein